MAKFSVLLSVYDKENPEFLKVALESIFDQSLPPNEVVLVEDGPLTEDLYRVIASIKKQHNELKVITIKVNGGLGNALALGLKNCKYDYVARMDSDDICDRIRFETQMNFIEENPVIDIVGSNILEFLEDPKTPTSFRKLPEKHNDIREFAKKRNPLNHVTVLFNKKTIESVGGYVSIIGFEDYFLWARLLVSGAKFHNIQENLVYVRVGNDMIGRRKGGGYIKSELNLFMSFYKIKHINMLELARILPQRILVRMMPRKLLTYVYNKYLRA